jgi:hypothetical protein
VTPADERFELVTNVRFPRSKAWALVVLLPLLAAMIVAGKFIGFWFFVLPGPLLYVFANRVVSARVVATPEGLRIGERLVRRSKLKSALVRHAGDKTFVAFEGDERVDVEVSSNVDADALLRALHLDATTSAVELALQRSVSGPLQILPLAVMVLSFLAVRAVHATAEMALAALVAMIGSIVLIRLAHRVTMRVGADGIAFQEALRKERFVPHDAIADVRAEDDTIVVIERDGRRSTFSIGGRRNEARESPAHAAQRSDEAAAIVRRIRQARQAFREGANAPELAVALERGSRSMRDWLTDLRRLGEGAASTFRTIGVAREQLFDVVESTTAAAKERVAAMVALRATLREEEKPRVRVAAERIASPELRERMVRVLDAEDEAEIEAALRELEDESR